VPMLKVGFSGAHGVGKTTLCRELHRYLEQDGIVVHQTPEVPREIIDEVKDASFFRRGNNSLIRQFLILARQIAVETDHHDVEVLLCDRTLVDHWAYTVAQFHPSLQDDVGAMAWSKFVRAHQASYGLRFYVPIEFAVKDDGVREGDLEFQHSIDCAIHAQLDESALAYHVVRGGIEERVLACADLIKGRLRGDQ